MAGSGRFHVAPEQAALRAQANHPDASRGKFGTRRTSAAANSWSTNDRAGGGGEDAADRGEGTRTRTGGGGGGGSGGMNDAANGGVKMVKMSGNKRRATGNGTASELSPSPGPGAAAELDNEDDLGGFVTGRDGDDDDDDDDEDAPTTTTKRKARFPNKRNAQSVGRRKIHIEFIEDRPRRHVTFTKRKSGLMKKVKRVSYSYSLVHDRSADGIFCRPTSCRL